jgi:hypothetical protein
MNSTSENFVVASANITMTSTTLVGRILQLIFIIYGEKFEKFNGLNFKK